MTKVKVYTDGGRRNVEGKPHMGWGTWMDFGDSEINYGLYGACGEGNSNNIGEITGYIRGMEEVLKEGYEPSEFLMDSMYVLDGCQKYLPKWKSNGWLTVAGNPVKNIEYWKQVDTLQEIMKAKDFSPTYTHVKAHTGIVGNEEADDLATKGVYASGAGAPIERVLYHYPKSELIEDEKSTEEVKPKKAKKAKIVPPNAFLCLTQILDVSHKKYMKLASGETIYMLETFNTKTKGADDEIDIANTKRKKQEAKTRNLGVIDPDMIEGIVFAKEQCPVYDEIKKWQDTISPAEPNYPYMVHWAKVTTSTTWKEIKTSGVLPFININANIFLTDEATNITYYLDVPRRATAAIESCMVKVSLLEKYKFGELKDVQDITDMFIDINDKGKQTFKKTNEFGRMIPVKTEYKGKKLTLRLTQKIDMPEVNALKRMCAQEKIKIKLVKYLETPVSFRHAIVVEGENNLGFYNSPCSSIRMVP